MTSRILLLLGCLVIGCSGDGVTEPIALAEPRFRDFTDVPPIPDKVTVVDSSDYFFQTEPEIPVYVYLTRSCLPIQAHGVVDAQVYIDSLALGKVFDQPYSQPNWIYVNVRFKTELWYLLKMPRGQHSLSIRYSDSSGTARKELATGRRTWNHQDTLVFRCQ